jgi:hypothetical protein
MIIHLVIGVLQQQQLTLVEMLHTLLSPHQFQLSLRSVSSGVEGGMLYHSSESLAGIFTPKQKSTTSLQ